MAGGSLVAAVAQFAAGRDVEKNLLRIDELTADAVAAAADLVVFPEASMYAWDVDAGELAEAGERQGDRFVDEVSRIAAAHGVMLVVGMFAAVTSGAPPHNRMLVADPAGSVRHAYDKVHLFDAFSWRESDKVTAAPTRPDGSELVTVGVGGFTLGLLNCYDLRFPEMARALVDRGADVLVVSSAWVAGPHKERHWETLLRARAIENTCYVLGSDQPPPASAGLSMVLDPLGLVAATCIGDEGVAVHRLDTGHLRRVREALPSLAHRRYRVVPGEPRPGSTTTRASRSRSDGPGGMP